MWLLDGSLITFVIRCMFVVNSSPCTTSTVNDVHLGAPAGALGFSTFQVVWYSILGPIAGPPLLPLRRGPCYTHCQIQNSGEF